MHVNLVAPHYVDSPMLAASVQRLVKKTRMKEALAREFFRDANPGARLVTVDDVAEAVVRLLRGDEHGTVLELDGSAPKVHHPNAKARKAKA